MKSYIDNLYKSYEFIGLSYDAFKYLAKKELDNINCKRINKDNINSATKRIKRVLYKKIMIDLSDTKSSYALLFKYINQKFNDLFEEEKLYIIFDEMDSFLKIFDYYIEPNVLISIIEKNSVFNNILKKIYNLNKDELITKNIDDVFSNGILKRSINTYCMINNIKIYNDLEKERLLTFDEEIELANKIKNGDTKARKIFIEKNLRLVLYVVNKYVGKGLELDDLVQEGRIGLITAVDKFDPSKGFKFSSFAVDWIRQNVVRAIQDKSRTIRIPVHINELLYKYKNVVSILGNKLNREPSIDEIADEMNISRKSVLFLEKNLENTISLDGLVSDSFLLRDNSRFEDRALYSSVNKYIDKIFEVAGLNEKEINILKLRAGLYNNIPLSLESIGKMYNVKRQCINRIEKTALYKIRKTEYIRNYAIFMDNPKKALEKMDMLNYEYILQKKRRNEYAKNKKLKNKNL